MNLLIAKSFLTLNLWVDSVPQNDRNLPSELINTESVPAFSDALTKDEGENFGLLGDFGGLRKKIADQGFNLQMQYKGDFVSNSEGGLERKSGYLSNLDLTVDADLEKLLSLRGLSLFIYGLGNYGDDPTEFVGDRIGSTNIQANDSFKIYELYTKYRWSQEFVVLAGYRDLNADFYSTEASQHLINSAFGISPSLSQTAANGPSIFPTTALAATFNLESIEGFYWSNGVFNAIAGNPKHPFGTHLDARGEDGRLAITEAGVKGKADSSSFKLGLGYWQYSKKIERFDKPSKSSSNRGAYLLAQRAFSSRLAIFAKLGAATAEVNSFKSATEFGLLISNLIDIKKGNDLSLGFARANTSSEFRSIEKAPTNESLVELNYSIELTKDLKIAPDVQYIFQSGVDRDFEYCLVSGIRLEIKL